MAAAGTIVSLFSVLGLHRLMVCGAGWGLWIISGPDGEIRDEELDVWGFRFFLCYGKLRNTGTLNKKSIVGAALALCALCFGFWLSQIRTAGKT